MTLHPSQILLIASLALFVYYILRIRTDLTDRLVFTASAAAGVVFVLYPDLTTWIANRLGIGRGADLLFYLLVIVFLFYSASVAARHRRLERQVTGLVRALALANPRQGPQDEQTP